MNITEEIYRDHLEGCFEHFCRAFYRKYPRGSKGISRIREPMSRFCGVSDQSLCDWMVNDTKVPVGEAQIRLMCYLDLHGYRVIEFERLKTTIRNLAELIGYKVVTAHEVKELLGYSDTNTVYKLVRNTFNPSESILEKVRTFCKSKRDELERKKKESFEISRLPIFGENTGTKMVVERPMQMELVSLPAAVTAILSLARGLSDLLGQKVFDHLTDDEMRSLSPTDLTLILELSVKLNSLSSRILLANKETLKTSQEKSNI